MHNLLQKHPRPGAVRSMTADAGEPFSVPDGVPHLAGGMGHRGAESLDAREVLEMLTVAGRAVTRRLLTGVIAPVRTMAERAVSRNCRATLERTAEDAAVAGSTGPGDIETARARRRMTSLCSLVVDRMVIACRRGTGSLRTACAYSFS